MSTMTCCDRFDRNCANTHGTVLIIENFLMVDPISGYDEINRHNLSLLPTLHALYRDWDGHKCASQVSRSFRDANWVVENTTAFHNCSESNRHQALKHRSSMSCTIMIHGHHWRDNHVSNNRHQALKHHSSMSCTIMIHGHHWRDNHVSNISRT